MILVLLDHVFKYYKGNFYQCNRYENFKVELTLSTASNKDYPVPKINQTKSPLSNIYSVIKCFRVETVDMLEKFLLGYFEILKTYSYQSSNIYISAVNFENIAQSESTPPINTHNFMAEFQRSSTS